MNGQLNEQPLAELVREISKKKLSGRLRVEQNRVAIAAYFNVGKLLYAAANVRSLRLREYLTKLKLVSDEQLSSFATSTSDLQLAASLVANGILPAKTVDDLQRKQIADVFRVVLLWTEGAWDFDSRSQLSEPVEIDFDPSTLFLEAARRLPVALAGSRFRNENEIIQKSSAARTNMNQLQPKEAFVLSRLERPMPLKELVTISGLPEAEALFVIYALTLSDHIVRQHWNSVFREVAVPTEAESELSEEPTPQVQTAPQSVPQSEEDELLNFLDRTESATTHYELLNIARDAAASEIKRAYYDLARQFHPDRFRRKQGTSVHTRLGSAFARITQAYEALEDPRSRSTYDAKLAARSRADGRMPPTTLSATQPGNPDLTSNRELAEAQFREGLSALNSGESKIAISNFASAARAFPNEARYRAFYGHALTANESTRRLAETELQAALRLDPDNPDYRTMLAKLYKALGFFRRARAEAERALTSAPKHEGARALLSDLPDS